MWLSDNVIGHVRKEENLLFRKEETRWESLAASYMMNSSCN